MLVTGAAGFIGSHLCDALLAQGQEVTGIDNFASGKKENLKHALANPRFHLVEGSVLDDGLMEKNGQNKDTLFHLAVECVRLSIGKPVHNHEVNATGTLLTLDWRDGCPPNNTQPDRQEALDSSSSCNPHYDSGGVPCVEGGCDEKKRKHCRPFTYRGFDTAVDVRDSGHPLCICL